MWRLRFGRCRSRSRAVFRRSLGEPEPRRARAGTARPAAGMPSGGRRTRRRFRNPARRSGCAWVGLHDRRGRIRVEIRKPGGDNGPPDGDLLTPLSSRSHANLLAFPLPTFRPMLRAVASHLPPRRLSKAEFVWLAFVAVQALDGVMSYIGVSTFGGW